MLRALFLFICLLARPALAQGSYTSVQTGAIDGSTTCAAPLVRDIAVADDFTLADVDLAFLATHSWRGDIQLTLVSPAGTSAQVIAAETTSTNQDNYNVVLDDEAADAINTGTHTTADGATAPPFENRVRPSAPLSAFDGESSQGVWRLSICDAFSQADNGTFQRAELRLTPAAPPPAPVLACDLGAPERLEWTAPGGAYGWPGGDLGPRAYMVGNTTLQLAVTGDTGLFQPEEGVPTPVTSTAFSGGTGAFSLLSDIDFGNPSQAITYTMSLGTPGTGLGGLAFDIYDVDGNPGAFQDRYDITASLNGANVPVSITPTAPANYVDGNSLIGLSSVPRTSADADGRIVVTEDVDTLSITYRPGPSSPPDPTPQFMAYSLIEFCPAVLVELDASKSVEVVGGGAALPGADVLYTITVENAATSTGTADGIELQDVLPDNLQFVSASVTGFSGGAFNPALPAANTDCGGGACTVGYGGASLGAGETGALTVLGRIK